MKKSGLSYVLLCLVILLISFLQITSCEPDIILTIRNNTDINLNVLVFANSPTGNPYEIGDLSPSKSIKYELEYDSWAGTGYIYVAALDSEGYLAFFRYFTREEVKKLGEKISITDEPAWHFNPAWNDLWPPPPWKTR